MIEPSINSLMDKAENLYVLCNVVGMRARQLVSGAPKLTECDAYNEVTVATNEISENKVIAITKHK
jgi:DNA-directed RNA polymerase subunit K/omega